MSDDQPSQDNSGRPEIGTALASTGGGDVNPFVAAPDAAAKPGGFGAGLGARLLDYSAHAAIIVGLIGFAWTVSSHLAIKPTAAQIEAPTKTASAVQPQKIDELTVLRQSNAQMAADLKTLHANLDALRTTMKQTPSEVRALEADLKSVKSGLNSTKSETDAALAQLSGKVDKLGRLERPSVDTTATGSIGAGAASKNPMQTSVTKADIPVPPAKPVGTKLVSADDPAAKPLLSGWVVRDVYDGVALIQGRRGPMEVVPGVSIPGAGVVKSIERHGNGWTVTTTKGQMAYAAPPRDYHRVNPRDYQDYPTGY